VIDVRLPLLAAGSSDSPSAGAVPAAPGVVDADVTR
jgi:hypothetical protein